VLKQYILGESDIPPKYRERIELPSRRLWSAPDRDVPSGAAGRWL